MAPLGCWRGDGRVRDHPGVTEDHDGALATAGGDEAELTTRASAGDMAAFRDLFDRTFGEVQSYVRRRVPASIAEDVVSDTYLRALEAMPRYEWRGLPFRAWLFRIAYRLIVDDARRTKRTSPVPDPGEHISTPDHGDAVADRIRAEELLAALDELPEPYRTVVELRYVHDWSVAEVATALDRKEVTVRSDAHRGVAMVRARVGGGQEP